MCCCLKSRRVGEILTGRFLPVVLLVLPTWPTAGKLCLSSRSWAARCWGLSSQKTSLQGRCGLTAWAEAMPCKWACGRCGWGHPWVQLVACAESAMGAWDHLSRWHPYLWWALPIPSAPASAPRLELKFLLHPIAPISAVVCFFFIKKVAWDLPVFESSSL